MRETLGRPVPAGGGCDSVPPPDATAEEIRSMAWDHCGIVRSAAGLTEVLGWLESRAAKPGKLSPKVCEARNIHQVLTLIARCALAREESRGAHYRTDYQEKRPEFEKHSAVRKGGPVEFR
jgi:L-aspartate oxidase